MVCDSECRDESTSSDVVLDDLPEHIVSFVGAILKDPAFTEEPHMVELFSAVLKDPRLLSLVELAVNIECEDLEQLLFAAEDYYSDAVKRGDAPD